MTRQRCGGIAVAAAVVLVAAPVLTGCATPGSGSAAGTPVAPTASGGTTVAGGSSTAGEAVDGVTVFPAAQRQPLPPISGTTLTREPLDLESLRGNVVVLNAWASWCPPCRAEMPELARLSQATPDVAFVGLDVQDNTDAAASLTDELGIPYPSIVDRSASLLRSIPGVPPSALPVTVVVDQQGRVAARVIGAVPPGALDPILADLVRESSASP